MAYNPDYLREWNLSHVGKTCEKCGTLDRYENGRCRTCSKADRARWNADPVNKERRRETGRLWREKNPEKWREICRAWNKKNPEKRKEQWAKRRERRRSRLGPAVADKIKAIYTAMEWLRAQGVDVHVDHIVPLAAGGTHDISNLQIVPAAYNLKKSDKVLV